MHILVLCLFFILHTKGIFGQIKICSRNSDCPSSQTCSKGFCENPCIESCGPKALCVVLKHQPYCFCKEDNEDCLPKRETVQSCAPECGKNSKCNTKIGSCECMLNHDGNPYKGCLRKCRISSECTSSETCLDGICKNPCDEDCGVNSNCVIKDHISVCSCPAGHTGDPFEFCRKNGKLSKDDICKQCGENANCFTIDDTTSCVCPRGFVGNPYKSCMKMCLANTDCPADKICNKHVCKSPCIDACGVNADCKVDKQKRTPICTCKDGFSGDPSKICTLALETRFGGNSDLQCSPKCGVNAYCDNKKGVCVCNQNFIGNPYGICRQSCRMNSDCPLKHACVSGDCKDPCLTACGTKALCTVTSHVAECKCPYGLTGDPFKACKQIVTTQSSIIDVDLCDKIECGTNAECRNDDTASCHCLSGYSGNPYKNCYKTCKTNSDCSSENVCNHGACENACKNACGINAKCTTMHHAVICTCPDKYKGDPFKICFPDAKGVLVNPSRVPCLKCICKAITGSDDLFACAEESISFSYWSFAGEDLAGGDEFRTRNATIDFITCMNNLVCILNTMNDYISRVLRRLNDIDCDGQMTCADYFAAHKFGLTAKFSDSVFNKTEARLFDDCENHGEKDVSNNWSPKKCIGPSYVEILS